MPLRWRERKTRVSSEVYRLREKTTQENWLEIRITVDCRALPSQRCNGHRNSVRPAYKSKLAFVLLCLLFIISQPIQSQSEPSILLVVFSHDKPRSQKAYQQIVKGIEKHVDLRIVEQTLNSVTDTSEINSLVNKHNASAIVLLGRKAIEHFKDKSLPVPVITGGTLYPTFKQQNFYGLSLTPAPGLLFKKLIEFSPDVKKIHVVYNPDKYQWLINSANQSAEELNLELVSYKASNLRSSAKLHRKIIENNISKSKNEAIWLLHDSQLVGNSDVLPYLLREAWAKEIIIFSSNPQHVQRGALLSLYSERELSGEELGNLAKKVLTRKEELGDDFFAATQLKTTINIRSAGHLGIRFNSEQLKTFDLIFPRK